MENKIAQEIYINDESNETVKKEYTISELKELLVPAFMINSYYAKCPSKYWIWQYEKKDLECEKWRKCPNFPKYEASNYGRIRDAKTKEIIPQYEGQKDTKTKKYIYKNADQVIKAIKKDPDISNIGWLQTNGYSVHTLVADAWLKPFNGKIPNGDRLEIHHISNDGYDNTPYNLIYVLQTAHTGKNGIHHGPLTGKIIPLYSCYPGPRKKLI